MIGRFLNLYYKIKYSFLDKRIILSRMAFVHHGATFIVGDNHNARIIVSDNAYIGRFANVHTDSSIVIGRNSVLSDYVYLSTLSHGLDPCMGPIMQQRNFDKGQIKLGENVFLGFGVQVMPNVILGDWCIVGAGSVVTKSFPSYCMIAGNPARKIKIYCHEHKKWIKSFEHNQ